MNTVSTKVKVPSSRDIMGSTKGVEKKETPVDYEQELDGVSISIDAVGVVCIGFAFLAAIQASKDCSY